MDGALMDPMWNNYVKLLLKLELLFVGPKPKSIKASLARKKFLFVYYHLMSHFEHGHLTLAQTVESLRVGQALNSLSFG